MGTELKDLQREVDSLKREMQQEIDSLKREVDSLKREQEFARRGHRPTAAPPLEVSPLLPPVPDFAGFGEGVVQNGTVFVDLPVATPPPVFLPDTEVLKEDGKAEQRSHYFGSLSFIIVATYFVLGYVALQLRNSRAYIGAEGQDIALLLAKHAWVLPGVIVCIYGITGLLVYFCYIRSAVSAEYGIDWEFWVVWVSLGCGLGLVEVCLLAWRPGRREPTLYATAMVMSHLPLLSERMDMTKDIIFIAIAAQHATWVAVLAVVVLLGSHSYFLWDGTIRGELLEAYFPVLLSTPAEEEECEKDEEKGEGRRCGRCGCGRCWRGILAAMAGHLLKQTSIARSKIVKCEDLPQAVLMLAFTVWRKRASPFVLMSLLLSALRVLLCCEWFSGRLHRCLRDHLETARAAAVSSGNAYRALAITQTMWTVEPGYSAPDLRTLGIPTSTLRAYGCSVGQLRSAGFELQELKKAGYEVAELKEADFQAAELKAVGFTAAELKGVGFSPAELKSASYTLAELKAVGCPARELLAVGVSVVELKAASFALAELKRAGLPASELHSAGFTAAELRAVGFSTAELVAANFPLTELKDIGYSASELRKAGFTTVELRAVGFPVAELELTPYQIKALGWDAGDLPTV